ncbi:receptor-like protein 4 [Camellia sinensis]|uniref:receptor-like protein 4 n=1 Tax=Camellia sinensis TaxID=4442 RepID=UPI0010364CB2|nr:receptor-like protein 4 [Camellia sinensis]
MSLLFLLLLLPLSLLLLFPSSLSSPSSYPFNTAYYIDCGGPTNSTDKFNTTWLSDRFYTAGSTGLVSEPLLFQNPQEKTLRFFPIASGKKNCYVIPVRTGRFYLRTFTVYDNYDGKARAPSFDMSVEGTLVFSWRWPWPEDISRSGAYSDLFAFISDGEADVCFYSIATDSPVIGSLELVQIDPDSYDAASIGNDSVLVNYGRLSFGSGRWGPGFNNDIDLFGRSWQSDAGFRSRNSVGVKRVSVVKNVNNTDQSPNYFPMKLYQSAVTVIGNGELEYEMPVDAKMDYLVWFHFAEIDSGVTKSGQRVFDVLVNDKNVSRVDIFSEVGSFSAYSLHYTVKNLSSTSLIVKLSPVVGAPIISGLENYAIVPADPSTVPDQVVAMRALKESLRVPDRMGWNGDPCAPTNWDAWEGVTCYPSKDKLSLVISQIDLGSRGLKGYISDQIGLLSNLVSLNLSTNFLGGTLPLGLGQKSLIKLDLSNNRFTGSIPDSLASSNLQLVLLNDNLLEGRVPEELYSVGVHGGSIDLHGNKGLCGVPSLPDCPLLSTGGKIAVGISSVVTFCILLLVIYICFIRRGRNDYEFGFPQELMALAAKRNRYVRQKSLMDLEMESQHAKGFIPNLNSS